MIKAIIILAILTGISYWLVKVRVYSMNSVQIFKAKYCGEYPASAIFLTIVFLLLALATIITTIIAVIRW